MKPIAKFQIRNWIIALGLFVISILIHLPFRSQYAYHWDSAEFSLALSEFNVVIHQPHPPGFFLYIMMGRVTYWLVSDPHASMVWVSVVCGGLLSVVLFVLGNTMFSVRAGIAAAVIAMTSPQVWFHSSVALMYIVDGLLVSTTVLLCWRAIHHRESWLSVVLIGIAVGIVSGVRQQTVPALVPLLFFSFWKIREQIALKLLLSVLTAIVVGLTWFLPMIQLSGGWDQYWKAVRLFAEFNSSKTLMGGGGWDAFVWNIFFSGAHCWDGLVLGVVVIAGALLFRGSKMTIEQKQAWNNRYGVAMNLILVWVLPMMAFGILVAYTEMPGHIFGYLPGLLLLVGVIVSSLKPKKVFLIVTIVICLSNAFVFLALPATWDGLFFQMGRTAREIRDHDDHIAGTISSIRSSYQPSEAIVCHAAGYLTFGFRLFQLHLPEFNHFHLPQDGAMITPPERPILSARNGKFEFVEQLDYQGRSTILLVVPPGLTVQIFQPYFNLTNAKELEGSNARVFILPAEKQLNAFSITAKSLCDNQVSLNFIQHCSNIGA